MKHNCLEFILSLSLIIPRANFKATEPTAANLFVIIQLRKTSDMLILYMTQDWKVGTGLLKQLGIDFCSM